MRRPSASENEGFCPYTPFKLILPGIIIDGEETVAFAFAFVAWVKVTFRRSSKSAHFISAARVIKDN
jgi:hypothetical protein